MDLVDLRMIVIVRLTFINVQYKNPVFKSGCASGNIDPKPGMSHYIPCLIAE